MRAAAELSGELAHLDHADDVRIFLTEEGHRAQRLGLGDRHLGPAHGRAGHDQGVDGVLDQVEPFLADRLGVGEVEPQPVGLDLAAGLLGVLAQMPVQGVVQQVGRRVGAADRLSALGVDRGRHLGIQADGTLGHPADVEDEVVILLACPRPRRRNPVAADRAGVADLPARLAVERGPVEDKGNRRAGGRRRGGEIGELSCSRMPITVPVASVVW